MSRIRTRAYCERGALLEFFAIVAVLFVLITIGFLIDVPTTQTVHAKVRIAFDRATEAGLQEISGGYQAATDLARERFVQAFETGVSESPITAFTTDLSDAKIGLWVPRMGINPLASELGPLFPHDTNTASIGEENLTTLINQLVDRTVSIGGSIPASGQLDDYNNMFLFYGRFTPKQYLPLLETSDVRVLSAVRRIPTVTYILIDPAFSLNDASNYNLIFGRNQGDDGMSDPNMWPVRSAINASWKVGQGWNFPANSGEFATDPVSGQPLAASFPNPQDREQIYRHYTAMCETLPWWHYKQTVVDVLDNIVKTSALGPLSLVGLTGYSDRAQVVPIHPKESSIVTAPLVTGHLSRHFPADGSPLYPLDLRAVGTDNAGLYAAKQTAFDGFVNSSDPHVYANRFGPDRVDTAPYWPNNGGGDDTRIGSGYNDWTTCLCNSLYTDYGTNTYLLGEDNSFIGDGNDEPLLHHGTAALRARQAGIGHWCDDQPLPGVDQDVVNLQNHRSGSGETARNLISSLAIRVASPFVDRIATVTGGGPPFVRPGFEASPLTGSEPTGLFTGPRHIGFALESAISDTVQARVWSIAGNSYLRGSEPLEHIKLFIFAFGLIDRETYVAEGSSFARAQQKLDEVLEDALCRGVASATFFFLPMDEFDRQSVEAARSVIEPYSMAYDAYYSGASDTQNVLCGAIPLTGELLPVRFYSVDYENFSGTDSAKKIKAARYFRNMSRMVLSQLTEVEYVM